jgi:hypothetical protein
MEMPMHMPERMADVALAMTDHLISKTETDVHQQVDE